MRRPTCLSEVWKVNSLEDWMTAAAASLAKAL